MDAYSRILVTLLSLECRSPSIFSELGLFYLYSIKKDAFFVNCILDYANCIFYQIFS